LQITSLQIEGIVQTWWDTQLEKSKLIMELGIPHYMTNGSIDSWDVLCHTLRELFYASINLHNILSKWLNLNQLPTESVQGYIDVLCKLSIQLHNNDPKEVTRIKFNFAILFPLHQEVDIFEISSLENTFL
jgi:hypothetical protein